MDELRRELERFLAPGMARYAMEEAPRIDALLAELEGLERRHRALGLAWPQRSLASEEGAVGFELPGYLLIGGPTSTDPDAYPRCAVVLLEAMEDYNGRLLAWGAGVYLAFFPGVTPSGSATQANLFRACQTAGELADLERPGTAQALTSGQVRLFVLETPERRLLLPVGPTVEEAFALLARTAPGKVRLSASIAPLVAERFSVDSDESGPLLGTRLKERRIPRAASDSAPPPPPPSLLERLSLAAAGMEQARPWYAPWQLELLGSGHKGLVPLSAGALLALTWPSPTESAHAGRERLNERLALESELCANWGGVLWTLAPHPDGPVSVFVFPDTATAAAAGRVVLDELGGYGGAVDGGPLFDYYVRGTESSAVVPVGVPLDRVATLAHLAPAGELVCEPDLVASLEPDFEASRQLNIGGRPLSILGPGMAREESGQPLLGCEELLEKTDGWLAALKQGRSVLGLVTGAPGSGKSRAGEELRDLFAEIGDAFLFHCQPWWAYDPYSLWRRTLLALWGPPTSKAAARAQGEALGAAAQRLGPFISRFTAGELSEPLWGLTPGLKGEMAGELLLSALRARGGRPLTLIVDDAHFLDAGSLQLIRSLLSMELPLAVLLCSGEQHPGLESDTVALQPLSTEEAVELYTELSRSEGSILRKLKPYDLVPARIHYLAALARRGINLQNFLNPTLDKLGSELFNLEADKEAVSLAALLGSRFGAGDLAALDVNVVEMRERLRDSLLLTRSGGDYVFRGWSAWQAAYNALGAQRRKELHYTAGRFHQQRHRGVTAQAVAHFMNCGDPVERVTALELAGERAAAVGSYTAAADYLRSAAEQADNRRDKRRQLIRLAGILAEQQSTRNEAAEILDRLWQELEEDEEEQRLALALEYAGLHIARGDVDGFNQWRNKAVAVDKESIETPSWQLHSARAAELKKDHDIALELYAGAARGSDITAALSTERLGGLLLRLERPAEAEEQFRRLADWAEENDDISLSVSASRGLARSLTALGRSAEAFGALEESLERERALLQAEPLARTLTELARYQHELGALSRAESNLDEARRLFERLGREYEALEAAEEQTILLGRLGRLDEARELCAPLAERRDMMRDRIGFARAAFHKGRLAALQGDWRAANSNLDLGLLIGRELSLTELIGDAAFEYARALHVQGRPADAAELPLDEKRRLVLEAETLRELYLFERARELHERALGVEPPAGRPLERLELALDHLAAGELKAGRRLLSGIDWPEEPDLELSLKLARARGLTAMLSRRAEALEEARAYREKALASGVVVDAALSARQLAAALALDGRDDEARGLLDESLAAAPPLYRWQLHFLGGLLAGRAGDGENRRRHYAAALVDLEPYAAADVGGDGEMLRRGEAYQTLRRGA